MIFLLDFQARYSDWNICLEFLAKYLAELSDLIFLAAFMALFLQSSNRSWPAQLVGKSVIHYNLGQATNDLSPLVICYLALGGA